MKPKKLPTDSEMIAMSDLVVGSRECQIKTVVDIMTKGMVKITPDHLLELMVSLELPRESIRRIREHKQFGKSINDCLEKVLYDWVERFSDNAKLQILIIFLRNAELNYTAEELSEHFVPVALRKGIHVSNAIREPLLDKHYTSSLSNKKPLQIDDIAYHLTVRYDSKNTSGCKTESILLTLLETPPLLSKRNILDLMSRLQTPVSKRNIVNEMLENDNVHSALESILREWFFRRSSTATLESLILHFRVCNLNSHADALRKGFSHKMLDEHFVADPDTSEVPCKSTDTYIGNRSVEVVNNDDSYYEYGEEMGTLKNEGLGLRYFLCGLTMVFGIILIVWSLKKLNITTTSNDLEYSKDSTTSTPVFDTWVSFSSLEKNNKDWDRLLHKQNVSKSCEGIERERSLVVDSYETFQVELSNTSYCDSLSVLITSNNSETWSNKLDLIREYNIINITIEGSITIETISEIIRQSANLVYLHINRSSDRLQLEKKYYDLSADCNIELFHLHHLSLSGFTHTDDIIEMMVTCVKMNLITFKFDGKITDELALQIFHLIQANRKTLREIRVDGLFETSFCIVPFDKSMNFLKILTIKASNRASHLDRNAIITYNFCKLFPEIEEIVLQRPVTLQNIGILQNCPKLRNLVVRVNIDLPYTAYDVINTIENFPSSKRLDINIYFKSKCPNSTIFQDFQVKMFELKIRYLRICSNCLFDRQTACLLVQNKIS